MVRCTSCRERNKIKKDVNNFYIYISLNDNQKPNKLFEKLNLK